MVDQGDGERREVRSPDIGDLARLARALAAADARSVLIGGFAVICHGFARITGGGVAGTACVLIVPFSYLVSQNSITSL